MTGQPQHHTSGHQPIISRTAFRTVSILTITLNSLSIGIAIALIGIAGHERANYMEYFRLIPDASRGVGYATALITTCGVASFVSPCLFLTAYWLLPRILQMRQETIFAKMQAAANVNGASEEEEEDADVPLLSLHASEHRERLPPPPPPEHAHSPNASAAKPVSSAATTTRFFVPAPFSRETSSGGEERTLDSTQSPLQHGLCSADRTGTTTTTTDDTTGADHAAPVACAEHTPTPTRTESLSSPHSPLSPHKATKTHRACTASLSTLTPHRTSKTAAQAMNPLTLHSAEEALPMTPSKAAQGRNKDAATLRAALFYTRYLASSRAFRGLTWTYLLAGFSTLLIIFACGAFGSLATAFASMSSGKDMERGWVVAYVAKLTSDGLDPKFNANLCRLQIDGKCSGGTVLCNAAAVATEEASQSAFCPICPASQQARINTYTQLCSSRYYVSGRYPVIYFVLVGTAALVLAACFVMTIVVENLSIIPFASYQCICAMARLRRSAEWARVITVDHFAGNWKDISRTAGMPHLSAHELLNAPHKEAIHGGATTGAPTTLTLTTSTGDPSSAADGMWPSGTAGAGASEAGDNRRRSTHGATAHSHRGTPQHPPPPPPLPHHQHHQHHHHHPHPCRDSATATTAASRTVASNQSELYGATLGTGSSGLQSSLRQTSHTFSVPSGGGTATGASPATNARSSVVVVVSPTGPQPSRSTHTNAGPYSSSFPATGQATTTELEILSSSEGSCLTGDVTSVEIPREPLYAQQQHQQRRSGTAASHTSNSDHNNNSKKRHTRAHSKPSR